MLGKSNLGCGYWTDTQRLSFHAPVAIAKSAAYGCKGGIGTATSNVSTDALMPANHVLFFREN